MPVTPRAPQPITLQLDAGADAGAEELDQLTRQLRDELAELPEVQSADLLHAGAAPRGSKAIDLISLGALGVSILPTAVPKLVDVLGGWLMRDENRKIKIKTQMGDRSVELEYSPSAMSQADLKQLVETLTSALQSKQA
ncbi:MAG: hypothetical protein E6J26_10015 [Chloroflexi bacterium]|nr:MAG: hypothetical protein E6J26_10015 [Chloroflexota bacterium]